MTNELAIRLLTDLLGTPEQLQEAVTMAVRALSKSDVTDTNVEDTISRQAAIIEMMNNNVDHVQGTDGREVVQILEDIPSARPKGNWIPVTERLPEHEYGGGITVLTVDLFGVMRVAYFDGGNWCWPSGEALTTMQVAPITHWMPLPEPPKEEE